MRLLRYGGRFSDATPLSAIAYSRRCYERDKQPGSATRAGGSADKALEVDDTASWIQQHIDRSVAAGRQSKVSAAYFESILHDQPEFSTCLKEARRVMGGQNPEQFTRYQQGQFADRMSQYISQVASERLMRAHAEESNTKRHTQDGSPTGENYWFEAGSMLGSPSVPGSVKDEILRDMQADRKKDSPAFDEPKEGEFLGNMSDDYAAHLRAQRRRLLDTDEKD